MGRLLRRLGFTVQAGEALTLDNDRREGTRPGDWTEAENRAIVADYLAMLALECAGKPYSKTGHRNALIEVMGGTRSPGSIEKKHQNISAVMIQLGLPYIKGYKPRPRHPAGRGACHLPRSPSLIGPVAGNRAAARSHFPGFLDQSGRQLGPVVASCRTRAGQYAVVSAPAASAMLDLTL